MSINQFTEDSYEQTLIDLFQRMGYQYECGYDVERDFREPWYVVDLQNALRKQNPKASDEVLTEAYRIVTHVNEGTLEQRNEQMMDYLQNGVEVKYSEQGPDRLRASAAEPVQGVQPVARGGEGEDSLRHGGLREWSTPGGDRTEVAC